MYFSTLTNNDYYSFGMLMPGRNNTPAIGYRYGFNGQEKDDEVIGSGNIYTAQFWEYDARLGRRWNMDPLFKEKPWMSPYHAFSNKPILNIDPNGANDTEYEVNEKGEKKKISDMGGAQVDFNHYTGGANAGKTEIVNVQTGESQMMSSSKNIKDYTRRDETTDWKTLYAEYKTGTGTEKSLMYQNHPMNLGLIETPNFNTAAEKFVESGTEKFAAAPFFVPLVNASEGNMTGEFIGKANYSFYEVGDKTVIIVIDSKSISSEDPTFTQKAEDNNIPREPGKTIPNSTTHQTYVLIFDTKIFRSNHGNK